MNPSFSYGKIGISLERRPYAEELFRKIEDEGRRADGYSAMLKGGYLLELLAFLGRGREKSRDFGKSG